MARLLDIPEGRAKETIKKESRLSEDLGADSLDVYAALAELEGAFDVTFPAGAYKRYRTVGQITEFIKKAVEYYV